MISIVVSNLSLVTPGLSFLIPVNTLSRHRKDLPIDFLSGSGKPYQYHHHHHHHIFNVDYRKKVFTK